MPDWQAGQDFQVRRSKHGRLARYFSSLHKALLKGFLCLFCRMARIFKFSVLTVRRVAHFQQSAKGFAQWFLMAVLQDGQGFQVPRSNRGYSHRRNPLCRSGQAV